MAVEFDVVSIGTLSRNPFWEERQAIRTPHATTTLVRSDGRTILVDPSLPGPALVARLHERTGLKAEQIDVVFLTSLRPVHRGSIASFPQAEWLASEVELAWARGALAELAQSRRDAGQEIEADVAAEVDLLARVKAAPDKLAEHVDLFPLPGPSPGHCGLILSLPTATIILAGDAVLTRQHLEAGRIWEGAADLDAARASLAEIIEIADAVVPGHDNLAPLWGRAL